MNSLLQAPFVLETRRNHALEHATIHILSQQFPGRPMAGHSNPTGFFLIGDLPTEFVRAAVTEALSRLQNGEIHLAIHPGCGTNYLVTGALSGLLGLFAMSGARTTREKWERLPAVILFSALGVFLAQPLGPLLQREVTTDPHPGSLTIVDIYAVSRNLHRIVTRNY